ncbi:MAG: PQQ-dependent dehydrogenase, methanol/ethanol family, partial [Rhodoferax sp.]|nr:PQQ-dependent dehydrogenase, methanol/ethanol family [Rhodoferax sp.]
MIANDAADESSVLSWGLGTQGQRYSSLTAINTNTVKNLSPIWSMSFGGEKQRGQESQPLIYKGKMFVTASYSRIFAVDVKTGQKLWKYEHRLPEGIMPCCDVVNRGAALYDNLVIFGTLDAQLVALEQDSGKVVWKEKIDDYAAGYSQTAAPLIAEGLLLTGVSGGEFGVVGRVEARDPKTGKLVWSRPVVEGHMGYKDGKENGITGTTNASWPGETWKTGGAATWLGGTYDAKTGLAYFGTGNPGPWNSHVRKGDNLYSASTVAINVKTGKIVWHYQTTPNDAWDYDGVNEFVTFDMDGKRMGGKADRNGFFYVIDASTGKLQNAFPFVNGNTWAKSIDLASGRPNFVAENRPGDPSASSDGKKGSSVFAAPGFLGGKNQMPMAYSPKTRLFYVPSNEWGMDIWNEPISYKKGGAFLGAGFTIKPLFDDHIGSLRAYDPKTGKMAWEV